MKIKVRLFAGLREAAGKAEIEQNLAPGSTIGQLLGQVSQAHPSLTPYLGAVTVAVNRRYAPIDAELRDGDEVALVPPVGGG